MRKLLLCLSACFGFLAVLIAQPANNDCTNPTPITDVTAFCSPAGGFSNIGATPSTYAPAGCFGSSDDDVWFSFVAGATDVNITVRGATQIGTGGTLQGPQVAMYFGTCGGTLDELECAESAGSSNIAELYQGGLFIGTTYLIRIQGANGANGTFQLCVNNYNPPVDPESDCPEASVLCDKSSFVVQNVTGAGADNNELDDAACFGNGSSAVANESNSTWFVWTCSTSGTLTMTLTPNNGPDDLDFVIYELPTPITSSNINCSGKTIVRCMASGNNQAGSSIPDEPCLGPTGMRVGDSDTSEDAGCSDSGDDAWLAPMQMEAGKSYALCVNNFSLAGNGFGVEFGGTGEFQGPDARFTTNPSEVCVDEPVVLLDASTFPIGNITKWTWSFGSDATPLVGVGKGPHIVTFSEPGIKQVALTVETNLGCKVTQIQPVFVNPEVEVDTVIAAPDCNGGTNGAITINNIKSGTPPYTFSWNNGPFTSNNSLVGLTQGIYSLVIKDSRNCATDLEIDVRELTLTVNPDIKKPLCTGDSNGEIVLNVTNGQAPYQFDWGNGFETNNTQGGFPAGVYTILGVDSELCKGTFTVTITDHPPVVLAVNPIDITCFGFNDGTGIAQPSGGVGNFTYQWSDTQTSAEAENLGPGTYTVIVRDANGCSKTDNITIEEPSELGLQLIRTKDLLCAGIPSGEIEVKATGGREPYEYSLDGTRYQTSPTLLNIPAGPYNVIVRDKSGCTTTVPAVLNEPLPLTVTASPSNITLDLGYDVQTTTTVAPGGRIVTWLWTPSEGLSCTDCPEPLITATDNYEYVVLVTDQDGCIDSATIEVKVNKIRPIYFPNVFKPGSDDFPNDYFTGFSNRAATGMKVFRVFDRWGSLVHEGKNVPLNDPLRGWDGMINGKPGESGVYTWYAIVLFVDQLESEYSGDITIIR